MADRIRTGDMRELVGVTLGLVPERVLELIGGVRFHEGFDSPLWGGVLRPDLVDDYRERAAGFYSSPTVHQGNVRKWRREPVVALQLQRGQRSASLDVALHELGHALWFRIIEPHKRWRVYWRPGDHDVAARVTSGIVPSMVPFTYYCQDDMCEQFAEAFALWLLPRDRPHRRGGVERFYAESRSERLDDWGVRIDNRRLLAFFNALAGLPGDLPPVGLR